VRAATRLAKWRIVRTVQPIDPRDQRIELSEEIPAVSGELTRLPAEGLSQESIPAVSHSDTAEKAGPPSRLTDSRPAGVVGPAPSFGLSVPASVVPFVTWAEPGHFYSPVPDLEEIEREAERLFVMRTTLPGIDLREKEQLACFRELAHLAREAPIPASPNASARYGTDNLNYGIGDAATLQAMLRRLHPRRYLEVGSGWSTALALDTSEQFLEGSMSVTAIEPYPDLLDNCLREGDPVEVLAQPVQSVPLSRFTELEANDVFFIDSSHVLKVASDVHFLFTTILPILAPGVYVHVHDMFWPFEYLQHWIKEGRAWNECYLVHAFLLFNNSYEIVLFNHYLAECHREVIAAELPAMLENTGGALWLKRVG